MGIYLDNSATSHPKPAEVYDAVIHTLKEVGANPGRGGHKPSLRASRIIFEARELIATFFNAERSSRIVFTSNATSALNMAIKGILNEGDEVITTPLEHNSVLRPLFSLKKSRSVEIKFIDCAPDGTIDPYSIEKLITKKTRLLVLNHSSNVIGTISPAKEIFSVCKRHNVLTLLDSAQTAGVIPIDVMDMNIDMLATAGHKSLLGPQGTGILYVKEGINLKPLIEGGTGTQSSSIEQPVDMPESLESGTVNTPGIAGLKAGVEFIMRNGLKNIRDHEIRLNKMLIEKLSDNKKIILYGPKNPEKISSPVSFNIKNLDCSEVGFILDEIYDIYVRVGLHCAPLVHKLIGTFPQGTVRISVGYFNTEEDIDAVVKAINEISCKV
ncbi:MAG: aminotransferase class V-fold PLP-dependent enzyme [Proteobacteria bacterium]|nr:aminotransferase class V-fold PLP-dependent enzyme [Pseudomonadota bacterium]